jgi:hypothetical protein
MTLKELYELAKALMFEKSSSKDYDNYYIPWVNVLLSENFDIENSLLEAEGEDPLDEIPYIDSSVEGFDPSNVTMPYHDRVNREILAYGLAAHFFIDDDLSKYDIFYRNYQNARMAYMRGIEESIEDVYGGY